MLILGAMCAGALVGRCFLPENFFQKKGKRLNGYLQTACTALLIFAMGISLGRKENLLGELASLGGSSFLFFALPTLFSILLVYALTRRFLCDKRTKEHEDGETEL